jgi:NADPH:quinone reductase
VIAVSFSARKVAVARELGAAVAVDYIQAGWVDDVQASLSEPPVKIVFDGVGGQIGHDALELLGPGGRFVVYGWSSAVPTHLDEAALARRHVTVARLQRPTDLRPLENRALAAAAAGHLVPVIGQRFALRNAAEAHRAIETRATIGKTVLRP